MKRIINYTLAVTLGLCALSCSDDHFDINPDVAGRQTLWESINSNPELTQFADILDNVYYSKSEGSTTSLKYSDMLNHDQTFTIWAPKNGSFDYDKYKALVATDPYTVEKELIQNHIVRYSHVMNGSKTAFYTMEMTNAQLVSRIVASISGVPSNVLMTRKLDAEQKEKYQSSLEQLYKIKENMLFDTREVFSISEICNSIRRMKENHPELKGVVIDYLQLIQGQAHGEMREHFVGRIARTLKNLAKELHIWIIALSQINRDNSNPIPTMNRLRDSGQVEEAADMVLLIYRPEYYNTTQGMHLKFPPPYENENVEGRAVIIIGKGRRTGIGSFICKFDAPTTTFSTDDRFIAWVNKDKEVMDNSDLTEREEKNNDMPF